MFNQVTDSARKFVREIKDNEVCRLVRSEVQFKKFAELNQIELKTSRGNHEGEFKKRIAVWSAKAEHGIIADLKNYKKFEKFCEEVIQVKEPAKRGRKAVDSTSATEPKKRGRRPLDENTVGPKVRGPKANKEIKEIINTVVGDEPDLDLEVNREYAEKHNDKEFIKVLKSEFKRLGVKIEASEMLEVIKGSQNIRDLLLYTFEVYGLKFDMPKNIK